MQDDDALDGEEQQDHIRIKKELDFVSDVHGFLEAPNVKQEFFPAAEFAIYLNNIETKWAVNRFLYLHKCILCYNTATIRDFFFLVSSPL